MSEGTSDPAAAEASSASPNASPVRDSELYALVVQCVREAHERIREVQAAGGWIPTVSRYPSLSNFDTGWPNVTHSLLSSSVPHYQGLFGLTSSNMTPIGIDGIPTLSGLMDYARNNNRLYEVLRFPNQPETDERRPLLGAQFL